MAKIKDFTPLVDVLVDELGLVTAAVFGRIWRYANGKEGVCFASQKKIAKELSLDRTTVNKHIQILIDKEYIVDLTPELKRKTHKYQPTKKAKIVFTISASVEENPDSVEENPPSVDENITSVEENNTNIELNRQLNKHIKEKVVVNRDSIKRALFEVGIHGEKIQQQISGLKHITPEYIKAHAEYANRKGMGRGLLIHKIKSGDPMPKNGGHQTGCDCERCRNKYISGKYADQIEH